jgi:NAD(P) transhydrogenase subunit alpha
MTLVTEIAILVLAGFVGFAVISKIPNTLHTPLMSGTNAIHGIVLLGGLLLMHEARGWFEHLLLVIAITFGTINIVGGFFVTDRMLEMFKRKPEAEPAGEGAAPTGESVVAAETDGRPEAKPEARR